MLFCPDPAVCIVSVGDGGAAGVGGLHMSAAGCVSVGGGAAVGVSDGLHLS